MPRPSTLGTYYAFNSKMSMNHLFPVTPLLNKQHGYAVLSMIMVRCKKRNSSSHHKQ